MRVNEQERKAKARGIALLVMMAAVAAGVYYPSRRKASRALRDLRASASSAMSPSACA